MPPAPLTGALFTTVAGLVGLVQLALHPDPFNDERALLVAIGMGLLTLVVTAGLLLSRGRWSRWSLLALGVGWIGLAARGPLTSLAFAVVLGGAAMLSVAAGPWLPRWLRHRPSAEGPPQAAVVLLISLLAVPVAIGVLIDPPGLLGWTLSIWAVLVAFGISRAAPAVLWAARVAHLPLGIALAVQAGAGGIAIALLFGAQVAVMWRGDVHLAVSPLIPERASSVPIPPELVDPAILRAAGLDDRGAPMEDS